MTTEEFHGHLMAALHGPHAEEIAARVHELMPIDVEQYEMITNLALIGVLSTAPKPRDNRQVVKQSMAVATLKRHHGRELARTVLKAFPDVAELDSLAGDPLIDLIRAAAK